MSKFDFKQVRRKSWIWLTIYLLTTLCTAIWVGNFWIFIILAPIFIDICITHYIPWRWWEKSPNKTLRSVMKLIEDLAVVLLLVHFINLIFFQQFKIPTSSLEKTYLVGDHLFVSKLSYGPRLPMTPLAFPLFHNSFPWGSKTYLDKPSMKYKRLKGLGNVKRNDIVVFNFPVGDTVTLKIPYPDYYSSVEQYGRERVWRDEATFGKVVYRPVDMRDHYVKRAIGMPGDTLQIIDNKVLINGEALPMPKHAQHNYFVQTDGHFLNPTELNKLGISNDDIIHLDGTNSAYFSLYKYTLGLDTVSLGNYGTVYHFPLTEEMREHLSKSNIVKKIAIEPTPDYQGFPTYPLGNTYHWTRDNYGPIWIPKKGATIVLTKENIPIYERCIRNYEGHTLDIVNGTILLDGRQTDTYTFEMDYYFMLGDNRHNSADSRAWGFVPEDHIVGKPLRVWLSIDKDKPLFGGKIRWGRFLAKPE